VLLLSFLRLFFRPTTLNTAIVDSNSVIIQTNRVVSTAIPVPEWVIASWKQVCNEHEAASRDPTAPEWVMPTIGDVFHAVRGGNVKDPHSTMLGGRMTRQRILQQAVECLIGSSVDRLCTE
jgi:hypothetical protein